MNTYKLTIAYDGTDYQGWQSQPHGNTIIDMLQKRFYRVFRKHIFMLGASRTDAGVHAFGQVALVRVDLNLSAEYLHKVWNDNLPASIVIRELIDAPKEFHPHLHVYEKTYRYRLFTARPMPDQARYGWHCQFMKSFDQAVFIDALSLYIGTHDFRSFCKLDEDKDTIRNVRCIEVKEHEGYLDVIIRGKSFLRYQIRRMIGSAVDVARRKDLSIDTIRYMLEQPKPQQSLLKAKAGGLSLMSIEYR